MAKDEMSQLEKKLKKAVPKRHALTEMGGGPSQVGNGKGKGRGRGEGRGRKKKA